MFKWKCKSDKKRKNSSVSILSLPVSIACSKISEDSGINEPSIVKRTQSAAIISKKYKENREHLDTVVSHILMANLKKNPFSLQYSPLWGLV